MNRRNFFASLAGVALAGASRFVPGAQTSLAVVPIVNDDWYSIHNDSETNYICVTSNGGKRWARIGGADSDYATISEWERSLP